MGNRVLWAAAAAFSHSAVRKSTALVSYDKKHNHTWLKLCLVWTSKWIRFDQKISCMTWLLSLHLCNDTDVGRCFGSQLNLTESLPFFFICLIKILHLSRSWLKQDMLFFSSWLMLWTHQQYIKSPGIRNVMSAMYSPYKKASPAAQTGHMRTQIMLPKAQTLHAWIKLINIWGYMCWSCHINVVALELDFTSHFTDFTEKQGETPVKVKAFLIDCLNYYLYP